MPVELECKIPVPDHAPIQARLRAVGATPLGVAVETNHLLDDAAQTLYQRGCGLRVRKLRILTGHPAGASDTMTFKGPVQKSDFKRREEVELEIADADGILRLFDALGYRPWIIFEKRRESWQLGPARIELDELPALGRFVEVEAPDDPAIRAALTTLGLDAANSITKSYPALAAHHLGDAAPRPLTLRF